MSCCSRPRRALGWAACLAGASVLAPVPARAQAPGVRELQVYAVGVASRPLFGGVGGALAFRDGDRNRWQGALAVGILDGGGVGARGDFAYHFLLDPRKRQGSAVYGGGGLTAQVAGGRVTPYVLLVVGAENGPGGAGGSFVELAVGGGVRLAIGYRWRKRNAPGS
jgi:hypothetical protein